MRRAVPGCSGSKKQNSLAVLYETLMTQEPMTNSIEGKVKEFDRLFIQTQNPFPHDVYINVDDSRAFLRSALEQVAREAREEGRSDAIFGREATPSFKKRWMQAGKEEAYAEIRAEIEGMRKPIDRELFLATPNSWYDNTGWNHALEAILAALEKQNNKQQ